MTSSCHAMAIYPFLEVYSKSSIDGDPLGGKREDKERRRMIRVSNIRTQDGDYLVVLDHLQRSRDNEAQRVDGLARVVQKVSGRRMSHGEVHGQRSEAAVAGQPEGRMFVEDLSVEVDANVGLHVLRAVIQHLDVHSVGSLLMGVSPRQKE